MRFKNTDTFIIEIKNEVYDKPGMVELLDKLPSITMDASHPEERDAVLVEIKQACNAVFQDELDRMAVWVSLATSITEHYAQGEKNY